jgi:hypothetical protein
VWLPAVAMVQIRRRPAAAFLLLVILIFQTSIWRSLQIESALLWWRHR